MFPDQLAFDIPTQSICDPECYPATSSWYFCIIDFGHPRAQADAVPGWNLFVAAMAQNISSNLSSNRIAEVYKRATLFGNQSLGIFPFRYASNDGSDISGMAK